MSHLLQNHGFLAKVASLGRLKTHCPWLTQPNDGLEESSGGSAHPLRTSRNNSAPWIRGSTFSAHRKEWAACWIFPFPVLTSGCFSGQDYMITGLSHRGSSFQGLIRVSQPLTEPFPFLYHYLLFAPAQSPLSTLATALPEAPPKAAPTAITPSTPTRPVPLSPRAREQIKAPCLPTFWPRKRLLVERTVKPSAGVPSVVLSALAALLTSPCFFLHKRKSQYVACTGRDPNLAFSNTKAAHRPCP